MTSSIASDPRQTAQDLRKAASIVTANGWTSGDYVNNRKQVCAIGAMSFAVGKNLAPYVNFAGTEDQETRIDAMCKALSPLLPNLGPELDIVELYRRHVITFNDIHCTGGPDLETLLIQAAEKIEADL